MASLAFLALACLLIVGLLIARMSARFMTITATPIDTIDPKELLPSGHCLSARIDALFFAS